MTTDELVTMSIDKIEAEIDLIEENLAMLNPRSSYAARNRPRLSRLYALRAELRRRTCKSCNREATP